MNYEFLKSIICNKCDISCKHNLTSGVFCKYIKDADTLLAATILCKFLSRIKPHDFGIYYEMLLIFASNKFDFKKKLKNINIKNMIKILAEIELNRKYSLVNDAYNYYYISAKEYYKNMFGGDKESDEYAIKIIDNGEIKYI